ncbi:MAG: hypothetical protein ACRBN8_36130 [Nannocystales bacterium]
MRRRRFLIWASQGAGACVAGGTASEPAPTPSAPPAPPAAELDPLEAAAEQLRARRADDGFTILVEAPFVVAGNEAPQDVQRRATHTIGWATALLKDAYFELDPPDAPTVWLFRDDASYRHWAKRLFDDEPDTPYGYFTAEHNALVMNISTGGGTLVHELVHPFIDTNFPGCPSWFDEGLASLYEQCGERDGKIVGFENWRLPGLQAQLRAGTNPTFDTLTHTSRDDFYADETGVHYAQARYLCFYLQHEGLLRRFYHAFHQASASDPSGYETLKSVLGTDDMEAFEATWKGFVLSLEQS